MRALLIALLLAVGCDGCDKCISSHVEDQTCMYYMYIYGADMQIISMIPIYYDCKVEVCDAYERPVAP